MISFGREDVFLATGASSGLGAACALALNRLGASVIGVGRNAERLEAVRRTSAYPEAFFCEVKDLAEDLPSLSGWVKQLKDQYGKMRGLLHCAGVCELVPVRLQEPASMCKTFEINVFAGYQLARGFLDRRNNTGAGASLVFIASIGAYQDNAGISGYAASKGAVISLAKSLACEFAAQKIRVNSISPAFIATPMTEAMHKAQPERATVYPLGAGQPEDVAGAAAFLLSDAARWITGQNLVVDGGYGVK